MTLTLGIFHIGLAILSGALSIPLVRGKVAMNRMYGVRIAQSFESDENWYLINRYGGKAMIGWSVPVALIGVGLVIAHFVAPIPRTSLVLTILFCFTPLLLVGALSQTLRWAKANVGEPTPPYFSA